MTQVPSHLVSVRKTAPSAPLSIGATLTTNEAANLVITRSASTATGAAIPLGSMTDGRSQADQSGSATPAFTAGDTSAIRGGNFRVPNFPMETSTNTIDLPFSTRTAITLCAVSGAYKTSTPGFDYPPVNAINANGDIDDSLVAYAGCNLFRVMYNTSDVGGHGSHDFCCGCWVAAPGWTGCGIRTSRPLEAPYRHCRKPGRGRRAEWQPAIWDAYTDMQGTLQPRDRQATGQSRGPRC